MRTYPVVHHLDPGLTLEQARLALGSGADGVFLISHHDANDALDPLVATLAAEAGRARVGVNYLGLGFAAAFDRARRVGAGLLWTDVPGITGRGAGEEAGYVSAETARPDNETWTFASVAFKYQPHEPDPPAAALNAMRLGFIPTTSGHATGRAPFATKVHGMAKALGGGPLAVASGLATENLGDYAGSLTHCLVATSVCVGGDEHRFDPVRLRRFIEAAKAFA